MAARFFDSLSKFRRTESGNGLPEQDMKVSLGSVTEDFTTPDLPTALNVYAAQKEQMSKLKSAVKRGQKLTKI